MALKDVMAAILRYSTEFGKVVVNYIKVVEERPILFAAEM